MKKRILKQVMAMALAGLMLPGLVFAQAYEKKADNFIILIDLSGSMAKQYADSGKTKLQATKDALRVLNANIKDLDYNAVIYTFTPFQALTAFGPYSREIIDGAVNKLPETHPLSGFFSKSSPLGSGIKQLDALLADLTGRTVVYLLSDGQNTDSLFPYKEAEKLSTRYDVCFSVLSLAETKYRKELLEKISDISACSKIFDVGSDEEDMKFAAAELYTEAAVVAAREDIPPVIGVAEGYSPPDTDNDGINDEIDKCQDTPPGFAVDNSGCRIPEEIVQNALPFQINKGSLSKESQDALNNLGNYLVTHPEMSVSVAGHTCDLGSDKHNMGLSAKRAETVYDYLVSNFDIKKNQISMEWYGETRPIASNATNEGRLKNRRVEINVMNSSKNQ